MDKPPAREVRVPRRPYNPAVISLSEALTILAAAVSPAAAEDVPLSGSLGRVLARDLRSDVDWPPFDTSAMDGYAVRLADARGGSAVRERPERVAAGDPPGAPLSPGEVVRIMTGAPLPANTEAVVPVERSQREGGFVSFTVAPEAGAHIRRRGESIAAGSLLVARGRRLRPPDIALAALAGADPVSVFRAPRITVAATGNEVVRGSQAPAPGHLRDSNGPMLLAECAARGWTARRGPSVPDDPAAVAELFAAAGAAEDFLVTTGGVSAGDLDLLPAAAAAAGFEMLFHGVAIRPGKPTAFARRGSTFWLGLPGNPVAASVAFHLLAREALGRFEGDSDPGPARISARLESALPAPGERDRFFDAVCVCVWSSAGSELRVSPLRSSGSHDLAAYARASALVHCPAGSPARAPGERVSCGLLDRPATEPDGPLTPAPARDPAGR